MRGLFRFSESSKLLNGFSTFEGVRIFFKKNDISRGIGKPASVRPAFRALIAAKDASILAHFRRSDIGPEMGPWIGYPDPRLRSRGDLPDWRRRVRDFPIVVRNRGPDIENYRCHFLRPNRGEGYPIPGSISQSDIGVAKMYRNLGILNRD